MARAVKKAAKKAAKKPAKKAKKAAPTEPEYMAARVKLENLEDVPSYYSNFVEVSSGRHEIALHFAQIPTRLSPREQEEAAAKGHVATEPLVRLIIAPTLLPPLITALQSQQTKHESQFGKIGTVEDQQED